MRIEPFKNLVVIELASVLAGPGVGMFFAELGARVIKIENKRRGGDVTRSWKLASEDPNSPKSAYYNSINWGKESLMLDLANPDDKKQLTDLIVKSDILISNFKKGSAQKLGLDHTSISKINPGIINANLTAYGEHSDEIGYDVLLQAETGYLYMTGEPGRKSVKMPVALIDVLAAHQLKEGILVALLNKEKTGKGSYITVSLAQSAIGSLANQASNFLNEGLIPGKMGSQHPNISPYGDLFTTADGMEVVLAVGSDEQFKNLCLHIGREDLAADPRFSTNGNRVIHRKDLVPEIQNGISQFNQSQLIDGLKERKVPVGKIRNMREVFELEEAREMILHNEDGSRCVRTIAFEIHSE